MEKFLVTGGLGVIGSRFVETVVQNGGYATILDAAEEKRNEWMGSELKKKFGQSIEIITERIEKLELKQIIEKSDFVLHAAAHTGIPHSSLDPNDDWMSNVEASRNILETMRKFDLCKPTVMLSSVKPYKVDKIPWTALNDRAVWTSDSFKHGINESCLLEPDEPYAASKMAQSAMAMAYARSYKLPVTVLRCSNLYGDAPCHGPRHGWLTWFCISAALGWEIEIQGSGRQTRDMLFSDDVASAVLKAFQTIRHCQGEVYNIGGGKENSVSIIEAVKLIQEMRGGNLKTKEGPGRINEDMIFITNHDKFSRRTGWWPKVSVREGIDRIIKWAEANKGELEDIYKEYR